MELKGKVGIVTGGGKGIGRAISLEMAKQGASVVIFDVDERAGQETAEEIKGAGYMARVYPVDVTKNQEIDEGVRKVIEEFGKIDILVNNAGITHPAVSIIDLDLEWLDKVVDVNFKGVYLCARRIGKEMISRRSGVIVNISSVAGFASLPLPVYGPMKSAVIMLTQILARDWSSHGVRVNAIAPGYVLTPLLEDLINKGLRNPETILKEVPMRKFLEPSDIAQVAVFLCSEKARYITGITIPIDGGVLSNGGWRAYGYE